MVVADVFAQAAGGVEGLFTLPTRVPLQRLREATESKASEPQDGSGGLFLLRQHEQKGECP